MIGSSHRVRRAIAAPLGWSRWKLTALVAVLGVVTGAASAAAGLIVTEAPQAQRFAATFDAHAVADPTIGACRALPGLQKVEGRYGGTMTVDGEEYGIHFVLEALVDRSAGLGSAEGSWVLTDRRTSDIVGRGELVTVVSSDPPGEAEPPEPDLELHGLLIGLATPPDPDLPAQRLVANFTASLGEGATFPHLKGTVGDPTVADPTTPDTAVLLPAVKC
jgi:hypothetical protein